MARLTAEELIELLSKADPKATVTFKDIKGLTSALEPIQDVIIREDKYPASSMCSTQSIILVNRSLTQTVESDKYDDDDEDEDWWIYMSDAGAIGLQIVDFAEYISEKYYKENNEKIKSHLGFGLIMLKDLVDVIENKTDIDIDAYEDLNQLKFFKNQNEAEKLIVSELK